MFVSILFSCATANKSTGSKSIYEVLLHQEDGGASIRFFEILTDKNEIRMLLGDKKLKKLIKPDDILTSNFILLNLGEKSVRGCEIGISSVIETEKNIVITVVETTTPESLTTQVITKPYSVVKINSKKEIIFK